MVALLLKLSPFALVFAILCVVSQNMYPLPEFKSVQLTLMEKFGLSPPERYLN
jgi:hypothetical protein